MGGLTTNTVLPVEAFDRDAMEQLRDTYVGGRCVVVGNGPSLNETDLSLLANVPYFAVNSIFLAQDRLPTAPTFFVVEDNAVVADNLPELQAFEAKWKLFPSVYRKQIGEGRNHVYFRMDRSFYDAGTVHFCVPRFSVDSSNRVFAGQSVTIMNLQLAYWLGFKEVALIGMDFSYSIPDDVERNGVVFTSVSADPNHFHPDYFGPGK